MGSKFKCLGGTSPPETLVSTPDSPNPPPLREIMLLLVFHCRKRFGNSGPRPGPPVHARLVGFGHHSSHTQWSFVNTAAGGVGLQAIPLTNRRDF